MTLKSNAENVPACRMTLQPLHSRPSDIVKDKHDFKSLLESYLSLKSSYNSLLSKQKTSIKVINRLKHELQSCKRRLAGRKYSYQQQQKVGVKEGTRNTVDVATHVENDTDNSLAERLVDVEREFDLLKKESKHRNSSNDNEHSNVLHQKLQESITKLNNLMTQYEYTENKFNEQHHKLEKILLLHGEYKSRFNALTRELHFIRGENDELQALLKEATDQNAFLEELVCKAATSSNDHKKNLEILHKKQAAYDSLSLEHGKLRHSYDKLLSDMKNQHDQTRDLQQSIEAKHAQNYQILQQKANSMTDRLDVMKRSLALQITLNEALEKENKEKDIVNNEKNNAYKNKAEELELKLNQMQQRIRLLEGVVEVNRSNFYLHFESKKDILSYCLIHSDENILEVHVTSGSFDLTDETHSFVAVDFNTFSSVLSPIIIGKNPAYDFTVLYKLVLDEFTLESLLTGLQIEVYTLKDDMTATPLAFTTLPMDLLVPSTIGRHVLKLFRTDSTEDAPIGTLNVLLKLHYPLAIPKPSDEIR